MAVCLLLESILVLIALRYYVLKDRKIDVPSFRITLGTICVVMLILVLGNIAQVGIWAVLFLFLKEFPTFSEAFYHSAVNFATLGYGDIVMSEKHKLLGPLEAINGVLMIGVSTAALMTAFQDALRKVVKSRRELREEAGD